MAYIDLICWCGEEYAAKESDLKRGWGYSCCKSHAAIKRDYGRSNPIVKETGKKLQPVPKKKRGANRSKPDTRTQAPYNTPNFMGSGVDKNKFMRYHENHGGIPQFNRHGDYEGSALCGDDFEWDGHK